MKQKIREIWEEMKLLKRYRESEIITESKERARLEDKFEDIETIFGHESTLSKAIIYCLTERIEKLEGKECKCESKCEVCHEIEGREHCVHQGCKLGEQKEEKICKNCYGKGYSTEYVGEAWAMPDFIGDKKFKVADAQIVKHFCKCETGQKMKAEEVKEQKEEKKEIDWVALWKGFDCTGMLANERHAAWEAFKYVKQQLESK